MELIVRRNGAGEETTVKARRVGDHRFEVEIGGRTYTVDRVEASGAVRSYVIEGAQFELAVRPEGERSYRITGSGGVETVEVLDPLTLLAEKTHAAAAGEQGQQVKAYMPGRVVTVLVEEGSEVTAGQGIVVLEAMKMENEIQTESAGVVTRLLVEPGQAVEGGDPLFEIGPAG